MTSRKKQPRPDTSKADTPSKPDAPEPIQPNTANVPDYRRCPTCWGGHGGTGVAYSTQGSTRYYKCKKCGHTWTATVRATKIEHREVDLDTR